MGPELPMAVSVVLPRAIGPLLTKRGWSDGTQTTLWRFAPLFRTVKHPDDFFTFDLRKLIDWLTL